MLTSAEEKEQGFDPRQRTTGNYGIQKAGKVVFPEKNIPISYAIPSGHP